MKGAGVTNEQLYATVEDVRRSQATVSNSVAKIEGWAEGINQTLKTMSDNLASVGEVRTSLARLEERDKHPDPLLSIMQRQVDNLEGVVKGLIEKEERNWMVETGKGLLISAGGGSAIYALFHAFTK